MIKEIEVKNTTEILESGLSLNDFENTPDIVTAVLSANGTIMTVKINRLVRIARPVVRKVALYYMIPSYENKRVMEYELGVFQADGSVDETTEYVFSLAPVLYQIIHELPEQLPDDTINIRLYTYESNMSFNYGTCYPKYDPIVAYVIGNYVQYGDRLWQCKTASVGNLPTDTKYWNPSGVPSSGTMSFNLPYTVTSSGFGSIPSSTDGWYALRVYDIEEYSNAVQYLAGEIVWYTTGLFKCLVNSLAVLPSVTANWIPLTTEEERSLYEFGQDPMDTIATILQTDMMITRHVKQKFIYDLLQKTNFKRYDNIDAVNQLEKIISMREASIVHLNAGNPIQARYLLDLIVIDNNSFTANIAKQSVVAKIQNFTL